MSTLFKPPPPDGKLTPKQHLVYHLLRANPDGITDTQAGVELHTNRGCLWCRPARPCRYATDDGKAVLRSQALAPLVIRRRTGLWQLRQPVPVRDTTPIPF